jgi:uncharacterized protein
MDGDISKKISGLFFRAMDKLRHPGAFHVDEATGTDLAGFDKVRQIVLVTYKRSGEAVPSPINHGVADGKLYVRTDPSTGKVKRIRNNPRVVVVPSSFRGSPTGPAVAGVVARILPETEHSHADRVIAANWSLPMKVFERSLDKGSAAFGMKIAYIEITPAPHEAPLGPGHPACIAGTEALLDDAERGIHPGAHVLHPDLVGQFDNPGIAEAPAQVGHLFIGDGVRVGGHRIGVADGSALVIRKQIGGRVVIDVLEPIGIQALQAHQHGAEVDAPGAAHGPRGPEHRQVTHGGRQLLRSTLQQALVHRIGNQQSWVMGGDGERLGNLAELALGVAVHQPGEQVGLAGGYGRDSGCHTHWTRQPHDV